MDERDKEIVLDALNLLAKGARAGRDYDLEAEVNELYNRLKG